MKLLAKYNRVHMSATIMIFLLACTAFYFIFHFIITDQLDDTLRSEQQEIMSYVQMHHQLPEIQNTREQWIAYDSVSTPISGSIIKSSVITNEAYREEEVRQLIFPVKIADNVYTVTVTKSQEETEDLIQLIILVSVVIIALILIANSIISRKVLNTLWNPFYATINTIANYRASATKPLALPQEAITEFDLLNENLNKMTARIHHDYTVLKTFTENASHEMQTPLAVIRSEVEMFLQNEEWKENSFSQIQRIEAATNKLAKLNQSLLLLAKLENQQFLMQDKIDLSKLLLEKIDERTEIIKSRGLQLITNIAAVTIVLHQQLAEMLVTNLLNNAIRHTGKNGIISIRLQENELTICNTAVNGALDADNIFERFYKTDSSSEGTGLGLAIVKQICTTANCMVNYQFINKQHCFTVTFTNG